MMVLCAVSISSYLMKLHPPGTVARQLLPPFLHWLFFFKRARLFAPHARFAIILRQTFTVPPSAIFSFAAWKPQRAAIPPEDSCLSRQTKCITSERFCEARSESCNECAHE